MGYIKSFVFNRTVMGLLISACIVVTVLDLYFDYSQSKVVNFAALQVAKSNVEIVRQFSAIQGGAASPIGQLNENLQRGGSGIAIRLISSESMKNPFEEKAYASLSKNPSEPYYVLDRIDGHLTLRYAVANPPIPGEKLAFLELDIPMGEFEMLQNFEAVKTLWVLVVLALISSISLAVFVGYIRHSAEILAEAKEKDLNNQRLLTAGYERFFPHQFLDLLQKKSILEIKLGDQAERRMTVLFADIRNFTSIIERKSPAESFKFINDYLAEVGPVIRQHAGFIDKYIGDAIMALFDKPDDALNSVIDIMVRLRQGSNTPKGAIEIGAGLHFGSLMVGTVGEAERMDGTVISDIVNTASRLEALNKSYGTHIIASEQFIESLSNKWKFKIRYLDHIFAKGKSDGVKIYEVFDVDPPELIQKKEEARPEFEKAMEAYRNRKFPEAKGALENCLKLLPDDPLFQLFVKRCDRLIAEPPPENWTPVARLSQKDEVDH